MVPEKDIVLVESMKIDVSGSGSGSEVGGTIIQIPSPSSASLSSLKPKGSEVPRRPELESRKLTWDEVRCSYLQPIVEKHNDSVGEPMRGVTLADLTTSHDAAVSRFWPPGSLSNGRRSLFRRKLDNLHIELLREYATMGCKSILAQLRQRSETFESDGATDHLLLGYVGDARMGDGEMKGDNAFLDVWEISSALTIVFELGINNAKKISVDLTKKLADWKNKFIQEVIKKINKSIENDANDGKVDEKSEIFENASELKSKEITAPTVIENKNTKSANSEATIRKRGRKDDTEAVENTSKKRINSKDSKDTDNACQKLNLSEKKKEKDVFDIGQNNSSIGGTEQAAGASIDPQNIITVSFEPASG